MIDGYKPEFYHGFGYILVVVELARGYRVAEDIEWLLNQIDKSNIFSDWILIEIPDFFEVQPKYTSVLPV